MKTKPVVVVETNMYDNQDVSYIWKNVEEALSSGRFDYLVDNGNMTEKKLNSYKTIKGLIKAASPNFYIDDKATKSLNDVLDRIAKIDETILTMNKLSNVKC